MGSAGLAGLVEPPAVLVYRVDGPVVADGGGIDDLFDLVVEDQDLAVEVDGEDGVRDLEVEVLDDDDAQLLALEA